MYGPGPFHLEARLLDESAAWTAANARSRALGSVPGRRGQPVLDESLPFFWVQICLDASSSASVPPAGLTPDCAAPVRSDEQAAVADLSAQPDLTCRTLSG